MTPQRPSQPIEILLVDDSPSDVLLTQEAIEGTQLRSHRHVVEDGEKAMAFLRREAPYTDAPRPQIILLDLNMPRKDGREVLAEIKRDEALCVIPVVVLTTSEAEQDVLHCYRLHANCFVVKPVKFDSFAETARTIEQFWFRTVTLPPRR